MLKFFKRIFLRKSTMRQEAIKNHPAGRAIPAKYVGLS